MIVHIQIQIMIRRRMIIHIIIKVDHINYVFFIFFIGLTIKCVCHHLLLVLAEAKCLSVRTVHVVLGQWIWGLMFGSLIIHLILKAVVVQIVSFFAAEVFHV